MALQLPPALRRWKSKSECNPETTNCVLAKLRYSRQIKSCASFLLIFRDQAAAVRGICLQVENRIKEARQYVQRQDKWVLRHRMPGVHPTIHPPLPVLILHSSFKTATSAKVPKLETTDNLTGNFNRWDKHTIKNHPILEEIQENHPILKEQQTWPMAKFVSEDKELI